MATETKKLATSTGALVTETVRDRDLQWRPALSVVSWGLAVTKPVEGDVRILNVGGGPARW